MGLAMLLGNARLARLPKGLKRLGCCVARFRKGLKRLGNVAWQGCQRVSNDLAMLLGKVAKGSQTTWQCCLARLPRGATVSSLSGRRAGGPGHSGIWPVAQCRGHSVFWKVARLA